MPGRISELDAVICQNRLDLIRHSCTQMTKEVCGHGFGYARMPLGRSELPGTVDGDEQIQLALFCSLFCHVDMKVLNRTRLALFLGFVTGRVR
jgi:hypothetical protein